MSRPARWSRKSNTSRGWKSSRRRSVDAFAQPQAIEQVGKGDIHQRLLDLPGRIDGGSCYSIPTSYAGTSWALLLCVKQRENNPPTRITSCFSVRHALRCIGEASDGEAPAVGGPADRSAPKTRIRRNIESLNLGEACVEHLVSLPDLHRAPFDHMLICQTQYIARPR
jgi:hypothetical protein